MTENTFVDTCEGDAPYVTVDSPLLPPFAKRRESRVLIPNPSLVEFVPDEQVHDVHRPARQFRGTAPVEVDQPEVTAGNIGVHVSRAIHKDVREL